MQNILPSQVITPQCLPDALSSHTAQSIRPSKADVVDDDDFSSFNVEFGVDGLEEADEVFERRDTVEPQDLRLFSHGC